MDRLFNAEIIRLPTQTCRAVPGFTLIELIVTLAVAAILSLIAVPSYRNFVESGRLTTATNDFVADISFARIAAMKAGPPAPTPGALQAQAVICASSNGTSCTAASTTWASGWIVFLDNDNNGTYNANDTLLKIHNAMPRSLSTTTNPTGSMSLAFNRIGFMTNGMTNMQINDTKTNQNRLVCLNVAGRAVVVENATSCP